MKRVAVAILLLALLGMAACGEEEPAPPAVEVPPAEVPEWANVTPEQIAESKKHGVPVAFENHLGMRFVLIPAGTFVMGSPQSTRPGRNRSAPQHEVTLTRPFYMQVMEVTNEAYRRCRPDHDAEELTRDSVKSRVQRQTHTTFGGHGKYGPELNEDSQPVTCVSWHEAAGFAAWLTGQGKGLVYRLPTEAEWEYTCRAGTRTTYAFGETLTHEHARVRPGRQVRDRRVNGPAEVGNYSPNAWGLHDMHGNALEWCADWYEQYSPERIENPKGPQEGTSKVIRGGSTRMEGIHVGSAERWARPPDYRTRWGWVGFRLVSPLPESRR